MHENSSLDDQEGPEFPAWLAQCVTDELPIRNYNLYAWNDVLMNHLYASGCNCTAVMLANHIENLICSDHMLKHSWWVLCIYVLISCAIILLSAGGNLTVIWIVVWHRRMRASITNYFLLNLAVADVSSTLLNMCFSFTYNLYYDWYFGSSYCSVNNFMGVTPTSASVFTLMAMSLDRYAAIVYPLRRLKLSRTMTIVVIMLIWLAASLCGLPMLLYSRTLEFFFMNGHKNTVCLADNYPDGHAGVSKKFKIYNYFLLCVNYMIPLIVLTFTYIRVGMVLWGSQSIGDYRHDESIRTKRKVIKMMIAVVSIFMVCWFPYHAYFTLFMERFAEMDPELSLHIYLNMYLLAMSSTIFNPIIYCWLNSKFRIGFKYAFRWLPCIKIQTEEYTESDLNRDRFNCNSGTLRRRSEIYHNRLIQNGDTPSPSQSNRRRTVSDVARGQTDQENDHDRLESNQATALLSMSRKSIAFGTVVYRNREL